MGKTTLQYVGTISSKRFGLHKTVYGFDQKKETIQNILQESNSRFQCDDEFAPR